jgi:hypothetical protein
LVAGVGGHAPGGVERLGDALLLHDLGDLVMECSCRASRVGLVATVPADDAELLGLRVLTVARGAPDPIGAPAPALVVDATLLRARARARRRRRARRR